MGLLKQAINKVLEAHIKYNNIVRLQDLVGIYNLSTIKLNIESITKSGFKKTGIYPYNQEAFSERDFIPSVVETTATSYSNNILLNTELLVIKSPTIMVKRKNNG